MVGKWSCREGAGGRAWVQVFPTGLGARPSVSPTLRAQRLRGEGLGALCASVPSTWAGGTHLTHHVGSGLPAPGADVLVEGDVEVGGRLVVLDHVEEGRGTLGTETGRALASGTGGPREASGPYHRVCSDRSGSGQGRGSLLGGGGQTASTQGTHSRASCVQSRPQSAPLAREPPLPFLLESACFLTLRILTHVLGDQDRPWPLFCSLPPTASLL